MLDSADRTVINWLKKSKITQSDYGRYLASLAAARNVEAERLLVRHLTDRNNVLNTSLTTALSNGMIGLLSRPQRDEATVRAILRIGRWEEAPVILQHQARLVLGALLHPYPGHNYIEP